MSYVLSNMDNPDHGVLVEGDDDQQATDRAMDFLCNVDCTDGCYVLEEKVYDDVHGVAVDEHGAHFLRPVREYRKSTALGFVGSYAPGEIPDSPA